jgi:hypothetical protein
MKRVCIQYTNKTTTIRQALLSMWQYHYISQAFQGIQKGHSNGLQMQSLVKTLDTTFGKPQQYDPVHLSEAYTPKLLPLPSKKLTIELYIRAYNLNASKHVMNIWVMLNIQQQQGYQVKSLPRYSHLGSKIACNCQQYTTQSHAYQPP